MDKTAQGTAFIPGIQLLRGAAALLVVACHVVGNLSNQIGHDAFRDNLTAAGGSGVDLFFVISGFVIFCGTFRRAPPGTLLFLWRRAARIYPFYWCVLALLIAMRVAGFVKGADFSAPNLLHAASLLPAREALLPVSWTLTYELLFYLLFAATLWLRSATASCVLIGCMIGALLIAGRWVPDATLAGFLTNSVMLEFCLGALLGYAFLRYPADRLPPAWPIVPLLVFVFSLPWRFDHVGIAVPEPRAVLWGPAMVAIVACSLGIVGRGTRTFRFGLLLGDASYAIYLLHPLVLIPSAYAMRHGLVPRPGWAALGVAGFLASTAAGIIAHLLVERPILRALRKFPRRRAATATTPVVA